MEAGFDSFEDSRRVLERMFGLAQAAGALDPVADAEPWDELARQVPALFADDVELVTRDGTLRGSDRDHVKALNVVGLDPAIARSG